MTVFVSSYHFEPEILPKDIIEITFFHTEIKTCGEGEGVGAGVGGGGWGSGPWVGNDKAFKQNFYILLLSFSNLKNYRGWFRAYAT